MNLAGALKAKGNAQEAYSAVIELGRIGNDKAIDLLIQALGRGDGVARSAARELGKLRRNAPCPCWPGCWGKGMLTRRRQMRCLVMGRPPLAL